MFDQNLIFISENHVYKTAVTYAMT